MIHKTFIQKFTTTQPNQCILHLPEVLNAIEAHFGKNTREDLENNKSTQLEISAILCDSPTQIVVKSIYEQNEKPQDLIEDTFFTYPINMVSNIISTQPTSGTIYLGIE